LTVEVGLFQIQDEIDTPSLVLDLDIFERNIDEMIQITKAHGVSLQPHAKTHRVAELGKIQVERGCDGLCVAKLGEAEGFAAAGIRKITVAYPIVGPIKAKRAVRLAQKIDLTIAADSYAGAQSVGKHFAANNDSVKTLLIINSGISRDGVEPNDAVKVALEISKIEGVNLVGIMTHEGSVYGSEDKISMEEMSRDKAELMVLIARAIRDAGVPITQVSMGASASARIAATVPGVTQIRPGIFAFNDLGQIALGNATSQTCAVRVFTTVVSHLSSATAVIDAGSKSLSQDGLSAKAHADNYPGYGLIIGKPGWIVDRLSEEHGVLAWIGEGASTPLHIGEQLQIIPNHVCTVFSSLNECIPVRGGRVQGAWKSLAPGSSR
jgi:D-serine deaminase-like pyridoxal phosphate-dependent protein